MQHSTREIETAHTGVYELSGIQRKVSRRTMRELRIGPTWFIEDQGKASNPEWSGDIRIPVSSSRARGSA